MGPGITGEAGPQCPQGERTRVVPLRWAVPHRALSWPFLPGSSQVKMLLLSPVESPLLSAPVGQEALGLRAVLRTPGPPGWPGTF